MKPLHSTFSRLALRAVLTGLGAACALLVGCATTRAAAPPVPSGTARVAINSPASREQLATLAQLQSMQRELAELRRALAHGPLDADEAGVAHNDATHDNGTQNVWASRRAAAGKSGGSLPTPRPTPTPTPPGELVEFEISAKDTLLASALRRWGQVAGYDVRWDSPIQARITGASRVLAPDFRAALGQTLESLQQLGYPLKALVYSDRVVRIVRKE